jgi:hypothetical protein
MVSPGRRKGYRPEPLTSWLGDVRVHMPRRWHFAYLADVEGTEVGGGPPPPHTVLAGVAEAEVEIISKPGVTDWWLPRQ